MSLNYTNDQLTREAQLLVTEIALLADIGDDAGVRAGGLAADSDFAQTCHPDALGEIAGMGLFEHASRVERHVRDQKWAPEIPTDVSALEADRVSRVSLDEGQRYELRKPSRYGYFYFFRLGRWLCFQCARPMWLQRSGLYRGIPRPDEQH